MHDRPERGGQGQNSFLTGRARGSHTGRAVLALGCLGLTWLALAGISHSSPADDKSAASASPKGSTQTLGLPPVPVPKDNPQTAAKIQLGAKLYWDKRLSIDNTVACVDCHHPQHGWSNGDRFATGVDGKKGGRSAPTVLNTAYQQYQFWDGRAGTLEQQALGPIQNPIEMNLSLDALEKKLAGIKGYVDEFQTVFGRAPHRDDVAKAIAAYERTVVSGNAPYDRFTAGDKTALSEPAQRGMKLFFGKARCSACHSGPNFTDNGFHNLGVGMHAKSPDEGRQSQSKQLGDRGSFKTPTLRDIARTAPYMHDGSLKTLEDVVAYYNKGGEDNPQLDEEMAPLNLTAAEIADLIKFLKEGLASSSYPDHKQPALPQ